MWIFGWNACKNNERPFSGLEKPLRVYSKLGAILTALCRVKFKQSANNGKEIKLFLTQNLEPRKILSTPDFLGSNRFFCAIPNAIVSSFFAENSFTNKDKRIILHTSHRYSTFWILNILQGTIRIVLKLSWYLEIKGPGTCSNSWLNFSWMLLSQE